MLDVSICRRASLLGANAGANAGNADAFGEVDGDGVLEVVDPSGRWIGCGGPCRCACVLSLVGAC